MSAVGNFRLGYGAYLARILSESSGENIVNWMRATLIVLLLIPVLAAHFYSVGQNFLDYLFAITSVCLLIVALSEMLSRLPAGFLRTFIGITALSLFSFYFYAQFLSYYFQGSYFNQEFCFPPEYFTPLLKHGLLTRRCQFCFYFGFWPLAWASCFFEINLLQPNIMAA